MPASEAAWVMKAVLREIESIRSTWASASETARTRPGKPAPAPTSAIRPASRSSGTSRPVRLSTTCTCQARSSVTLLTEARSSARSARTVSRDRRWAGLRDAVGSAGTRLLVDEGRDDDAAVGLVALAVGLDPGTAFQPFVDDAALLGAHRVHLDDPVVGQRLLGRTVGAALERLAAPAAVARGVDDHAFAVSQAAEGRLVAEQLQGVDRLAPFADQEA